MRRLSIYLIVALLTFAIGTVASALFYSVSPSAENAKKSVFKVETRTLLRDESQPLSNPCACEQVSITNERDAAPLASQEQKSPIIAGILNAKAKSLPNPAYPAIARAAHASGTVAVEVVIDERGCVQSARAISGHPLLQQAAVEAACHASFAPTRLSGQPVKVKGVLNYNFVVE